MIHCFSGIGQRFIDNIAFLWILQFFQNQAVFLWNQTMFPRRNATFSRSMLTWHCISRRNILQSMLMAFIFADKLLAQHADMPLLFPEKLFMEHADEHLPSQRIPFMEDAVAALNSWTICFVSMMVWQLSTRRMFRGERWRGIALCKERDSPEFI